MRHPLKSDEPRSAGGPLSFLPSGRHARDVSFSLVPIAVTVFAMAWGVRWLDAGSDWYESRNYVSAVGEVHEVELLERRGRRGRINWKPRVLVAFRHDARVYVNDQLRFGPNPAVAREEAESLVAPYAVGGPAEV